MRRIGDYLSARKGAITSKIQKARENPKNINKIQAIRSNISSLIDKTKDTEGTPPRSNSSKNDRPLKIKGRLVKMDTPCLEFLANTLIVAHPALNAFPTFSALTCAIWIKGGVESWLDLKNLKTIDPIFTGNLQMIVDHDLPNLTNDGEFFENRLESALIRDSIINGPQRTARFLRRYLKGNARGVRIEDFKYSKDRITVLAWQVITADMEAD
jgi:hypothetical protein